jgi:hypothetical protein
VKLPGRYKGTRQWHLPVERVRIECPGCGWKSKPNLVHLAEFELRGHLEDCHTPDRECAFCRAEFQSFEALEKHVPQCPMFTRREKNMALSWNDKKATLPGGAPLLKGSDVPKNVNSIKVKVTAVREAPKNFQSPIIIDIQEMYGKSAMALNKTSCQALADRYDDDLEKLVGKTVQFWIALQNNPKSGKLTRSLTAVEPA